MRIRVFFRHQHGLWWCLGGLLTTWILLAWLDRWETNVILDEVEGYGSITNSQESFPGKCRIRNFDNLKRMSIVYTWVNGSLPCYRETRQSFGGPKTVGGSRDREIGELMYSIRSLEKFMPWHEGNIYIVTPGHIPHWLNMSHPRIQVIHQDDIFPASAKEFLPTFNTNVLEQFLYRIPGLSDIFMQINDDYIFTAPMTPHDLFSCDGGIQVFREPNLIPHDGPTPTHGIWMSSVLHTQAVMDAKFGRSERHYLKHAPFIYSRRAFERLHQIFSQPLLQTLSSRFRNRTDMNIPLLHHYYMVAQGTKEVSIPVNLLPLSDASNFQLVLLRNDNMEVVRRTFQSILAQEHSSKVIALNDEYSDIAVADNVHWFLPQFLLTPSEFEKNQDAPPNPLSVYDENGTCTMDKSILGPALDSVTLESTPILRVVKPSSYAVVFFQAAVQGAGWLFGCLLAFGLYEAVVFTSRKQAKEDVV
ncbi:hypothetical protein LEN26_001858 [Aphanomyces euteiches]|nr:hypothetical protein AeMF1_021838 [Aphanomyces euteiches]KAH9103613.1 hypothetical protein AeMF1_020069 [Aphanomyces euteiches]KAH9119732.1 hypothetical protein AeMF1_007745 [Aphanomyces euteiches]KAH9122326.1 hypothetical protein AeMF1_006325 [Aphanomyces euteiches]KAH9160431.1 hypothetical protein LEN26_001858 [Aphanomyces euteiches]